MHIIQLPDLKVVASWAPKYSLRTQGSQRLLQDLVVNFNAKNPCLLEKAKQTQIKTVKELEYLITEVPWNSSHLWEAEPFMLLLAAVREETENTKCPVNKAGKQHPCLGHHDSSLLPFLGGWGGFSISGLPSAYLQYLDEASAPQRHYVMHLQVSIYVAAKICWSSFWNFTYGSISWGCADSGLTKKLYCTSGVQ